MTAEWDANIAAIQWDLDIAAMQLSDVEKNGLQVYRNYTRAFEQRRNKEFSKEANNSPNDVGSLRRIHELILSEDPRFLAVIVCSFIDEHLDEMFRREIPEDVPGGRSALFSGFGPLSRLSQRLQIAYSFGWLSSDLPGDVDKLRKLRNEISHDWDIRDLRARLDEFIVSSMSPIETHLDDGNRLPKQFYTSLDAIGRFRVRLIWMAGRIFYESILFPRAVKRRLDAAHALYGPDHPELLWIVSESCVQTTRKIIKSAI